MQNNLTIIFFLISIVLSLIGFFYLLILAIKFALVIIKGDVLKSATPKHVSLEKIGKELERFNNLNEISIDNKSGSDRSSK